MRKSPGVSPAEKGSEEKVGETRWILETCMFSQRKMRIFIRYLFNGSTLQPIIPELTGIDYYKNVSIYKVI